MRSTVAARNQHVLCGAFAFDLAAIVQAVCAARQWLLKKVDNHCAVVALYVMYYNFVRTHETLKSTPAVVQGLAGRAWSIGELLDAAIGKQPITPHESATDRRRKFRVIDGGKQD